MNATAWNWDFGDGFNSTDQNPVHTYFSAGTYVVNLTANNANKTASKEAMIYVLKTASSNKGSSDGSDGKGSAGGISTAKTSTPAKESKNIPGFETVYMVLSLLAASCVKGSNKR